MKRINLKFALFVIVNLGFTLHTIAQNKVIDVKPFDKVIISPHIEVVFRQGTQESVIVESNSESPDIFNVEVKNKTLHLYLDDAKITSPTKTIEKKNGWKQKEPIYKGTIVKVIVNYKYVETFALRGEEHFLFESPIVQDQGVLRIYGESQVVINEVQLNNLKVVIYGESLLEIKGGVIGQQKISAYGESSVNTHSVSNKKTKLTAYGDGDFKLNVSQLLKITSFGEASISYTGTPDLRKGIVVGETTIVRE